MPAEQDVTSTTPVGGRYELRALLGRGGMGSVWRGEDLLLQRPVAVKRVELPAHLPEADRAALRQRVMREARAAARVGHPRLVTIFDVVEEEGTVFLVQELVDAPTLKQLVRERGPLAPTEVARIGVQLADGLAAAHASGVVHRDVKPSNVMVRDDGSIKLADFGIASVSGDPQITATGMVIGSPAYMAPEQATGEQVGAAADVWSLGATLYFAVEGEQPFGKSDTLSTLTAVVHEPPRPTRRAGGLAPVLDRLLDKDAAARPTVADAARLLGGVTEGPAAATAAMTQVRSTGYVEPDRTVAHREIVEDEVVEDERAPVHEPMRPARRSGSGSRLAAVTVLLVVLLAGGIALALTVANRDDTGRDALDAGDTTSETTTAPSDDDTPAAEKSASTTQAPATTAAPGAAVSAPAAAAAATVPAGWTTYTDPKTGYRVAHPEGWRIQSRGGNRTDFTDPATGSYLRVDWTDTPGESAQADWERQSDAFGKNHENYREIRIEPTTFAGSTNASLWEFSYTDGGAALHAYNLGFVLPDRTYGFALNFQTKEERWAASQPTWEQLKAGFSPPS